MQAKGQQGIKRGLSCRVRLNGRTVKHVVFVHIVLSLHLISRNVMLQTHSSREILVVFPSPHPTDSYIIHEPFFPEPPLRTTPFVSSGVLH